MRAERMTERERYYNTMHFLPVDHVPDHEFGWWGETFGVWHEQGLPKEIDSNEKGDFFFGFEVLHSVGGHTGLIPSFEPTVIEETETTRIVVASDGVTYQESKVGSSIPHYIKFPIESRADWEEFKERLKIDDPKRVIPNVQERVDAANASDKAVSLGVGSLFGWIRNWMGFEGLAMMTIDDPELVEEMVSHLADLILAQVEPFLQAGLKFENAHYWEDIAFKNGPMVSPKFFNETVIPHYKRMTDRIKEAGCDVVSLDCDGNVMPLVKPWLDGGVNTMFPIEIRGGSDPHEMRRLYGHDVLLSGGMDKIALIEGKETTLAYLKSVEPLLRDGGFILHVDHRVPPDVTYDTYLYYVREKRAMLGIPEPAPYEDRLAELRENDPERAARFDPKN